jgi:hypothetical protein
MKPLLDFFKKKMSFEWKEKHQRVFEDLKEKLLSTLMLKFLDFTKPFKVHTDANDFTIEGIFMQDGQLIVFKGKKLYGAQLRWPIHEKELWCVASKLGNIT